MDLKWYYHEDKSCWNFLLPDKTSETKPSYLLMTTLINRAEIPSSWWKFNRTSPRNMYINMLPIIWRSLDGINQSLRSSVGVEQNRGAEANAPLVMSVRVSSSLTNKRLRSGKSRAAPGTDRPVGGRTAETIIQSCREAQGERQRGEAKKENHTDCMLEYVKQDHVIYIAIPPKFK